jgi:hypothetical protein
MTEKEFIINSLDEKIKKLIVLHNELKGVNKCLLSENNELKGTIKLKENELKDLHGKYEKLMLAKLLETGGDDVHDAKLKVNRIVREIDRCIALLNK